MHVLLCCFTVFLCFCHACLNLSSFFEFFKRNAQNARNPENTRERSRERSRDGRGRSRERSREPISRKNTEIQKTQGIKKKRRGPPKSEKSKKMNSLSTTYPVAHFLRWFHFFGEIYQQRHNATTPRRHATTPQRHSATAPQCHSALRHNATTPRRHATTPRRTTPGARQGTPRRTTPQRRDAQRTTPRRHDAAPTRHATHNARGSVRGGGILGLRAGGCRGVDMPKMRIPVRKS